LTNLQKSNFDDNNSDQNTLAIPSERNVAEEKCEIKQEQESRIEGKALLNSKTYEFKEEQASNPPPKNKLAYNNANTSKEANRLLHNTPKSQETASAKPIQSTVLKSAPQVDEVITYNTAQTRRKESDASQNLRAETNRKKKEQDKNNNTYTQKYYPNQDGPLHLMNFGKIT
jgi:hypothetical protein